MEKRTTVSAALPIYRMERTRDEMTRMTWYEGDEGEERTRRHSPPQQCQFNDSPSSALLCIVCCALSDAVVRDLLLRAANYQQHQQQR